ncbi:MAG: hypothetical protein OJF50_002034 [Nitrospira sp.]|nr:hypothetical protein [Nitrospira sp.]
MFQWGHGISAMEIIMEHDPVSQEISASMGPRHFSRGIRTSTGKRAITSTCFNGATAFQPWN